jgi:hypothetical protein
MKKLTAQLLIDDPTYWYVVHQEVEVLLLPMAVQSNKPGFVK